MACWEAAGVASLVRGAWRGLPARAQLLVLRGAARALALSAEPDAGLLRALGQPLPRSQDPLGRQQVLSNVSKLQLLFRERAGAGDAGDPPEPAAAGLRDELDKDDATAISAEGG
ncbi:uncharacterized protein, partial [Choristoneura fumiferana]|uniref:uncharacterized protein n=1 Tax=Choristoneura fumiferana TaxID=7141 RepID=UPI003D157A5A